MAPVHPHPALTLLGKGEEITQQKPRLPTGCKTCSKPRLLTKALKPPALLATLKRQKMLHSMDTATSVTIRERTSLKGQRQVQTETFSHNLVSITQHGYF